MIDIIDRLRFDAVRCEATFSKGVASNIEAAMAEIERLWAAAETARGALLKIEAENTRAVRQFTNVSNKLIEGQLVIAMAALNQQEKS